MGSYIEINDTLRITTEQGFPQELKLETHLKTPFKAEDFTNKIFEFKNKKDIRVFHGAPIGVFLVQSINDKWLYWGHAEILEVTHHFDTQTTSGKFRITKIFTPDEMKQAEKIAHRVDPSSTYFSER